MLRPVSPTAIDDACAGLRPGLVSVSEIAEMRAQCELGRTLSLGCDDGTVVVELRPYGETLELFTHMAVASRFGAFGRQLPALLQVARELTATTVAFQSRRRGWSRRLGPEWRMRNGNEFWRYVDT